MTLFQIKEVPVLTDNLKSVQPNYVESFDKV
jgi:hypothetical protein